MKRLVVLLLSLCFVCDVYADISYLFSEYSVMSTALASRGMSSASLGILANPASVSFSRDFEFTILGVYMPYDRFGGVLSSSVGLYRLTGVDIAGGMGLTVILGGVNNIDLRDENGTSMGVASTFDWGVVFDYGTSVGSLVGFPFDLGVGVKYLSSSLRDVYGSGVGVDLGAVFNPIKSLPDLGFSVGMVNLYSSKTWSTGTVEMLPTRISLGAFYYLLEDSIILSLGVDNISLYEEILSFKWINLNFGVNFAVDPNLFIKLVGSVGNQFSVSFGLSYGIGGFSKIGFLGWVDGMGFNSMGSVEFLSGVPRYLAKVIDPEVQKRKEKERTENLEREYFSKAMLYFSTKDYRNAKKYLEEVLKINPDNDTAKAMLKKIEDILAIEE
ncbi:MAG: hypothetical protein ABDH28_05625 [Brevinematia bacterium]